MTVAETEKHQAAVRAVAELTDGMILGLGTGTTASYAIREIGRRVVEDGLEVTATASSLTSEHLARSVGIRIRSMSDYASLDVVIDGADEIDPEFRMIKGGGGALFREKVVASAARRTIIIVDSSKLVLDLGSRPLPVEVHPFALSYVRSQIERLSPSANLRLAVDGAPFRTDQQALILDVAVNGIDDVAELADALDVMPGVLAHGLFCGLVSTLIVGTADGAMLTEVTR